MRRISVAAWLVYFPQSEAASVLHNSSCTWDTSGWNALVDSNLQVTLHNSGKLPDLPDGTPTISYGHISGCDRFNGTILVGAPLSMGVGDNYFGVSTMLRRSVQIFLDWLNDERHGVKVNGNRYSMQFRFVDDASSKQQVTNATAHAIRGAGVHADFAFAGYSSGLTELASQQSFANGRLMMAASAASPAAFKHNDWTFGTSASASTWMDTSIKAISEAHAAFNKNSSSACFMGTCGKASTRGRQKLKAGVIQANALFTASTCAQVYNKARSYGMSVSSSSAIVDKTPTVEQVKKELRAMQQDGVNVVFGCTYEDTGMAIIKALEQLDFAPVAVVLTATVALPAYADLIHKGWWQGEYLLGPSPWHESFKTRGSFSGMTSAEFAKKYRDRYKDEVAYQGASMFGACCSLVAAIEDAQSLDNAKVVQALRNQNLEEFFGNIGYDSNGQNYRLSNLVLQYAPGASKESIVYPLGAASNKLVFPMPTWAQRRCRVLGPGKTAADSAVISPDTVALECSGNGLCDEAGLCVCKDGWHGNACSSSTTVEETGLGGGAVAGIVCGIIIIGCCCMGRLYYRKQQVIRSMRKELEDLKDSVVGMRSVTSDYCPSGEDMAMPLAAAAIPTDRVMWYWAEDPGRMSAHNVNLTMPPHWVQYAGSVATELEQQFTLWQAGTGPAVYATDLTDRISSTGTEAKAHGGGTGCKYTMNFAEMKQINAASGYKRDVLRHVSPAPPSTDWPARSKVYEKNPAADAKIPGDLAGEVFLQMKIGSIVQLQKQRPDGWAFGNIIYDIDGEDAHGSPASENVSFDAGWFPLACTSMPTKEALSKLQNLMGGAGADCLAPPDTWADLKDPLVAQFFTLPDGPEKQKAVDSFKATLAPSVQVVQVERVQNLALWQSYAVKRQAVLSREQTPATGASGNVGRLERIWLFHGTSEDTLPKITQQGFNRSFCGKNATMYGKGVYFARDAAYSSSRTYAVPDSKGVQRMFLCRVVVGEYCRGKKDALAPDVRDAAKHHLYDTTVDNTSDPSIYVTYHDAQAYPEYLVTFKQP